MLRLAQKETTPKAFFLFYRSLTLAAQPPVFFGGGVGWENEND
jgi:hypothetical protein